MSSTGGVEDLTDSQDQEAAEGSSAPAPMSPTDLSGSSVPVEPVIVGPTRAERPATWLAATLVLVLVFSVGVLLGQSGALGGLPGGSASGATNPPTSGSPVRPAALLARPMRSRAAQPTARPALIQPARRRSRPRHRPTSTCFWQALACIRQNYVGRADLIDKDVTYGAINGMVEALGDTGHSVFLTPEALASEQQSLSGTVEGIGALLGTKDAQPVIVSVITGGPASAAGMKAGDVIVSVNGEKVGGMNPSDVATKIRGPAGTQVTVVVLRPSTSEQLTFNMTRAKVDFPSRAGPSSRARKSADLRLIQFSSGAADALRKARDEATSQGAEAFILDLRSNPGGFVPEAVNTASLFLHDKTVYIRELADGERIPVQTNNEYPATDLPMVMLIDAGTASSAEIVSAAIKSAQRGDLVGETTYGTGTVLLTFNLNDGSAVRIAVERWLTPDGDLIFGKGIAPTVEVALPTTATPPRAGPAGSAHARTGADDGGHPDAQGHPDPAGSRRAVGASCPPRAPRQRSATSTVKSSAPRTTPSDSVAPAAPSASNRSSALAIALPSADTSRSPSRTSALAAGLSSSTSRTSSPSRSGRPTSDAACARRGPARCQRPVAGVQLTDPSADLRRDRAGRSLLAGRDRRRRRVDWC